MDSLYRKNESWQINCKGNAEAMLIMIIVMYASIAESGQREYFKKAHCGSVYIHYIVYIVFSCRIVYILCLWNWWPISWINEMKYRRKHDEIIVKEMMNQRKRPRWCKPLTRSLHPCKDVLLLYTGYILVRM